MTISEKTSPPIHEGLAGIFNGLLPEKMPGDKLKVKLDKYTWPENVKGLKKPKVNPIIWNQLSASMKARDARSQKGQHTLIGSIIAMTKAADLALQKNGQDRDLITILTDAMLQCNHEVNHSRRAAMLWRKRMMHDYAALCNPSTVEPTSEVLFGNLSKLTKDISKAKISCLLLSCDRIPIKLQLTSKSRLIFQLSLASGSRKVALFGKSS